MLPVSSPGIPGEPAIRFSLFRNVGPCGTFPSYQDHQHKRRPRPPSGTGFVQTIGPKGTAHRTNVLERGAIAADIGEIRGVRPSTPRYLGAVSPENWQVEAAAALVLIDDLKMQDNRFLARLRHAFGLIPAKALLALETTRSDGRKNIALALGLSEHTVRTHLTWIFGKTRAQLQAALVRMVLEAGMNG